MHERSRVWLTRIVAPIAFLAAATILVILVQRALDDGSGSSGTTTPTTASTSPEGASTGAGAAARRFYRVRAGDTLEAIASRFETTVDRLLQLNPGIDPLALTPRQRVRVA